MQSYSGPESGCLSLTHQIVHPCVFVICAAAMLLFECCFTLSSGFLASKVPDNLDAIIIGSGAGGLGLAVLLAKVGKKVLVLEQHDRAGGCCHTFTEKGFEFDVGEMGSCFLFFLFFYVSDLKLRRL